MKRKGIILKRTPKIKIAFAIIGIAFGLLLTSVFVFDKINQDKKVISPINAQNCGSGTFTWHNCTACYKVGTCGGSLTYTCGSICLNPSCGAAACSCDGICNVSTPSGYQATNNSCSTTSVNGTHDCGQSCSVTFYRQRYAINLTENGGTGTNCKDYTTTTGPCGGTANTAFGCTRSGYTLSSYTQSGCGGTWNSSTGVCSSVTATLNVTANWTQNPVRVSYTENPVNGNASATGLTPTYRDVTPGSSAAGPSFTTAPGYVFVNFTITSGSCAGTFTASTGTCSVVNAAMTIQANWKIRVSYTENPSNGAASATFTPTYRDVDYGASATGPTYTTNTGYVFVNFTITSGSCAGTFTASTGTCSNVQVPITIQANWNIRVSFTENFSVGGSLSRTYVDVAYGGSETGATPTPATGWTFVNFTITSGSCAGTFTASTGACTVVNAPITIQANWSNTAPAFTVIPAEATASYSNAPTNIGTAITFNATATDASNTYYLVICSTNAVTAGASGAAPTCGGTRYCVSTATASGVQASCAYTTISGNAWSNAWYGFVCDSNTSSASCSATSQGSGNPGSPFYVNHAPAFTASAVSAAVNPGGTITWTTTASDPDGNTVKLLMCKTQAISAGACTGGSWCTSSLSASNPTCSYVTPNPYADGAYNAYPYIVDQFNLASSGAAQGVNKAFTVNNVAPTVGTVTLNGGAAISLTESTTTAIATTAVVDDDNGCTNLSATAEVTAVKGYLYRSGVTYTGCDTVGEANNNYCYPEITCSVSVACSAGVTTYSCSASVQYYSDPTDANTPHAAENWLSTLKATDDDSASSTGNSAGVELLSIAGGETTPTTLDFGNLSVGQSNTYIDVPLLTKTTGNSAINIKVKASTASLCTDYPTCSTTGRTPIPIGQQKYSLNNTTLYSSGTSILTTTDALVEIKIPKQTTSTQQSKYSYWGIAIPTGTLPGVYNGLNVITYQKAAVVDW